jgi:hypothetical protein
MIDLLLDRGDGISLSDAMPCLLWSGLHQYVDLRKLFDDLPGVALLIAPCHDLMNY